MLISQRIRALRLQQGFTQAELSRRAGLAQPNLAAFESGARRPSLYTVELIAGGLGVSPSQLLEDAPGLTLDRFQMDALARALVAGAKAPKDVPVAVWNDLHALLHSKLKAIAPGPRRVRLRISASAAQRRLKALLGPQALNELLRRLDKFYPGDM